MADQSLNGLARMRGSVKPEVEEHIRAFDEAHRTLSKAAGTILDDVQTILDQRTQGKATTEDTLGVVLALTSRVSLNEVRLMTDQQERPQGFARAGSFATTPTRTALSEPPRSLASPSTSNPGGTAGSAGADGGEDGDEGGGHAS